MFNKDEFANILQEIISQYDSISSFTQKSSLDRTYISKCVNKKLEHPPSPNILRKISNNSNHITNYITLMYICGYLNDNEYSYLINSEANVKTSKLVHNFYLIQYNKLNKTGQQKIKDYIDDLVNTNKYNKEN